MKRDNNLFQFLWFCFGSRVQKDDIIFRNSCYLCYFFRQMQAQTAWFRNPCVCLWNQSPGCITWSIWTVISITFPRNCNFYTKSNSIRLLSYIYLHMTKAKVCVWFFFTLHQLDQLWCNVHRGSFFIYHSRKWAQVARAKAGPVVVEYGIPMMMTVLSSEVII